MHATIGPARARPSPTDEPTRLPDAVGCLSLLKRKAPASGLQAAGLRRPIRFGPGLLILTDYDAVYAYHLREVRCARTHDPMREASGGRPPRQPDPGLRTERHRAGIFFRRIIPDRNLESPWGSVLAGCQCRAIAQPRFDDCSMVAQIALKTESPRGLLSGPGPTRGAEAAEGATGTGRVASNRRPRNSHFLRPKCTPRRLLSRSGRVQVRFLTRPKSRTMRAKPKKRSRANRTKVPK
jgi:hypothetical protein